MSMCPICGCVYDESEYAGCPRCHKERNIIPKHAKKTSDQRKKSTSSKKVNG